MNAEIRAAIAIICFSGAVVAASASAGETPAGKKQNGTFVESGWHDYGTCNGDDFAMCGRQNGYGCQKPDARCASGFSSVAAVEPGDGKCIINWFRWECAEQGDILNARPVAETEAAAKWRAEMRVRNQTRLAEYSVFEKRAGDYLADQRKSNPCVVGPDTFASGAAVIVVGANQAVGPLTRAPWTQSDKIGGVRVDMDPASLADVDSAVLMLSNYNEIEWIIDPKLAARLNAILISGSAPSFVSGVKKGVPIVYANQKTRVDLQTPHEIGGDGCTVIPPFNIGASPDFTPADRVIRSLGARGLDYAVRAEKGPAAALTISERARVKVEPQQSLTYEKSSGGGLQVVPPGNAGVAALIKSGGLRPATLEDIDIVERNLTARTRALGNSRQWTASSFKAGKTYVITAKVAVPAGLSDFTFLVPDDVPAPLFADGAYQIYWASSNTLQTFSIRSQQF